MEAVASEIAQLRPRRIIVISPHGTVFSDGMAVLYNEHLHGNLKDFGHPHIALSYRNDRAFVDQLVYFAGQEDIVLAKIDEPFATSIDVPDTLDHGALVPLWFINKAGAEVDIVHITYGLLAISTLYQFGTILKQVVKKASGDSVIIASGDLSHALQDLGPYAFHPAAEAFDQMVLSTFESGDPMPLLTYPQKRREVAKECGFRSLAIAWGAFDRKMVSAHTYSYESPFGVGYMVASLSEKDGIRQSFVDPLKTYESNAYLKYLSTEDDYVKLARRVIEHRVKTGERLELSELSEHEVYNIESGSKGCFVSIKNASGLRGCIGTIYPTRSHLVDEIIDNAIKAATEDPRFDEIEEDELEGLIISVDVLMAPERVVDQSHLNPHTYGVIVTAGVKKGLLLPDLEGVDTVEEQLRIAKSKAGIKDEPYVLDRFEVVRHEGDWHE